MQVVTFDNKPAVIQYNADGTYYYNTEIKEVEFSTENGETDGKTKTEKKWQAEQYTIQNPITKANVKRTVILEHWDKDEQEKLINEYNSVALGVITEQEDIEKVTKAYTDFLKQRDELVKKTEEDLKNTNLQ
ncbi:MAG: hypothetical protein IJ759_00060 [Bacteroidales bacterium]|nr:hypothetical protein [Bacteroidales bacterium]